MKNRESYRNRIVARRGKPFLVLLGFFFPIMLLPFSGRCQSPDRFTDEQVRKVEALAASVMAQTRTPGVWVGVWEGKKAPLILARGKADIASGRTLQAADRFRIASVTKTFTGTVVLQLIDEGPLNLEDTVEKYFPELPNAGIITIRRLLNMTAGVNDFFYGDPRIKESYQTTPLRKWNAEELYRILVSLPSAFQPGEKCVYSNANFFLLAIIVEKVTRNRIAEEIEKRIIKPLGLTSTSYPVGPEMTGAYAHGYRDKPGGRGIEDITLVDPSLPGPSGAMISNLYDLKIWAYALAKGSLLSESTQKRRLEWNTMASVVQYGLGIMNWAGFYGHNGEILGYNNFTVYHPGKDVVIVVAANKANDDGSQGAAQLLFLGVTKILYPDIVPW